MKTAKIGIVLGLCTLLLLTTCVTTPKNTNLLDDLTRDGYFTLREHNEKGRYGPVFIFTERHNSRLIQAEIAWALDVLRETGGINSVALEGMYKGEVMDAEKPTYSTDTAKYIVTLALLEHGEIKAPELMYLAQNSFVFGIENEDEYNVMSPNEVDDILWEYLMLCIAIDQGKETLNETMLKLLESEDDADLDLFFAQYPWVYKTIETMQGRSVIEIINRLTELEEKVKPATFLLDAQTKTGFRQLKEFYEAANKRSLTMAGHVFNTLRKKEEPLSMIIGYNHTKEVVEFFDKNRVSYYVLEPRGLNDYGFWSDLTNTEYERREKGLPFFANKQIESFFTNKHNSRPVVGEDWFKKENNFVLLAERMIELAESGIVPETQDRSFFFSNGLEVSRNTLDISNPNDLKFSIGNESGEGLCVRVVLNPQGTQFESFQKALVDIIDRLYQLDEQNPPFSERIKALEGLVEVFNVGKYAVYISPSSEVWKMNTTAL
ncbi:MAG: hypothetical protein FWF55_08750 [Treponema sp.]|nr:hypothetical protein [Treponema sp.]